MGDDALRNNFYSFLKCLMKTSSDRTMFAFFLLVNPAVSRFSKGIQHIFDLQLNIQSKQSSPFPKNCELFVHSITLQCKSVTITHYKQSAAFTYLLLLSGRIVLFIDCAHNTWRKPNTVLASQNICLILRLRKPCLYFITPLWERLQLGVLGELLVGCSKM